MLSSIHAQKKIYVLCYVQAEVHCCISDTLIGVALIGAPLLSSTVERRCKLF